MSWHDDIQIAISNARHQGASFEEISDQIEEVFDMFDFAEEGESNDHSDGPQVPA